MPGDMFITIKGLEGESKDKKAKEDKAIDIDTWGWGMSNASDAQKSGGAGKGKVSVHDISITKSVDAATPKILLAVCNGAHFEEATIVQRKSGGDDKVEFVKIKLETVFINQYDLTGSGDNVHETLRLNFAKYSFDYTPQDSKGKALTPIPASYDILANSKGS